MSSLPEEMLTYYARLPDREFAVELKSPTPQQASQAAVAVMESTRQIAFEYSPINWGEIRALAGGAGKTISPGQLAQEVSSIKQAALETKLVAFVEKTQAKEVFDDPLAKKPKGEPLEIALSAYLAALFDAAFPPEAVAWQKPSKERREVRLVANYSGWQAVKKVDVGAAERKEVVAAAAGIFERAKGKLPSALLGLRVGEYEAAVEAFLSKYPERKSFSRLGEILTAAVSHVPVVNAVAGGDKQLEARLQKLFFYSCFERAGFTPFVSAEVVGRVWPELKIPKPRGNFGAKKKK